MVPRGLRVWFVIHFALDILFAVPLLIAPVWLLELFGWTTADPVATRLVGAALVGIGVESWFGRKQGTESFVTMLRLKLLWSGAAVVGWAVFAIFTGFFGIWLYWLLRLKREMAAEEG